MQSHSWAFISVQKPQSLCQLTVWFLYKLAFFFTFDDPMRTNRQKHCSLWLCHAIGVLICGFTGKSDTVVEFDSDRCFFLLWLPNFRKFCMCKHSCSYVIIVPWNNIQKRLLLSIFSMQRKLWRVCTFVQARLSLRPGTEISCAGSNNDLCTVYKNSEWCGEAAPATTGILCNHQCVVSMRQKMSQCFVTNIPQ